MLLEKIQSDLKEALKAKDEVEISTLRFLLSSIHNREIELRVEKKILTDEEVIKVIQRQVKERKESIEAFKKGKREDLVKKEQKELQILSNYLPQEISEKEMKKMVEDVIKEIGATGPSDFGKVMGAVMSRARGRAEGEVVARIVKKFLKADIV